MTTVLRPLTASDEPAVLALNEEVVAKLSPMDSEQYRWFLEHTAVAWAAEVDEGFAGFVLLFEPGQAYASANYRWFGDRYDRFLYLDRVAVAAPFRRRGVGSAIYDAVAARAAEDGVPVVLEVNVDPPNLASLAFHAARGFVEVGRLTHDGGLTVSLQRWDPALPREPGEADHLARRPGEGSGGQLRS